MSNMAEISEEDLATSRRIAQLLALLNGNPEARVHLERGLKVIDPKLETTEDQHAKITSPLQTKFDELQAKWDAKEEAEATARTERAEAEALGKLTAGFERLRGQGLTPEGEEKVKQIMQDRTIPDPEAAFALFEKLNPKPPQEAASWTPEHWNYEADAVSDTKALFADPDKWGDDAIGQILMEERRRGGSDS